MKLDLNRWPHTAEFLWALERERMALAENALTAAWCLGSIIDRRERVLVGRVAAGYV